MFRKLKIMMILVAASFAVVFVGGCESEAQTASAIGALAGAGIGQLAGGDTESTLIGTAVGAGAGYILGNESDKKRAEAERDYMQQEMNTVTANITNSNGSVSQVKLREYGVGYIGTRGEYYRTMPTEDQLRVVYGF